MVRYFLWFINYDGISNKIFLIIKTNMFTKGKAPVPRRPLVTKPRPVAPVVPVAPPPPQLKMPNSTSEFDNNTKSCFECISLRSKSMSVNGLLRHLSKCLDRIIRVAREEFKDKYNTKDGRAHVQRNCLGPLAGIISQRSDIQMLVTNGNDAGGATGMNLPDQIRQDFVKILVAEFRRHKKHVVTGSKAFQKTYNNVSGHTQLHLKLEPEGFGREVYPDGSYLTLSDSVNFDPRVMGIAISSSDYSGLSVYFKPFYDNSIGKHRVSPGEHESNLISGRSVGESGRHNVFKNGPESKPFEMKDLDTLYVTEDGEYQQSDLNHFYETQDKLSGGMRITRRY